MLEQEQDYKDDDQLYCKEHLKNTSPKSKSRTYNNIPNREEIEKNILLKPNAVHNEFNMDVNKPKGLGLGIRAKVGGGLRTELQANSMTNSLGLSTHKSNLDQGKFSNNNEGISHSETNFGLRKNPATSNRLVE